MRLSLPVAITICTMAMLSTCCSSSHTYRIVGNIDDPQNQLAITISKICSRVMPDSIAFQAGSGSLSNIGMLEHGKTDLAIVDNYAPYNDSVTAIMPLYGQVLHLLVKQQSIHEPVSFRSLLENKKVYAGLPGSGSERLLHTLMDDYGIDAERIQFVDVYDLFEADVVFLFTDLLTNEELRDMAGYHLLSLDDVSDLGKGAMADGICIRHPEFQTFVIPRELYGSFTTEPIVTLRLDALLVCRSGLSDQFVYDLLEALDNNRKDIMSINPLLQSFPESIEARSLTYRLHPGAVQFFERSQPTFLERYADVLSVIISIFIGIGSLSYSVAQWQRARKKSKIDAYFQQLLQIWNGIPEVITRRQSEELTRKVKRIQEETIHLMTQEKISADESFSIFMGLSSLITREIKSKETQELPA